MSHRAAILFPGQGAQFVGMGKALLQAYPAAKQLYHQASHILGYDLLRVCTEGPAEELNCTRVSQPAVLVTSLAAAARMESEVASEARPVCFWRACDSDANNAVDQVIGCGLSLGEYTALAHAEAFSFEDAVRVVYLNIHIRLSSHSAGESTGRGSRQS